jgi:hypothetical protein
MDESVLALGGFDGEVWPESRLAELAELADRSDFDMWVGQLRRAEASIRRYRKRLEALRDGRVPRRCPVCGGPVAGRADAVYCGDLCRLRAYRDRLHPGGPGEDTAGHP